MVTATADPIGRISGIPLYANGAAPDHLLTKAALEARRLRPAPGQAPAAYIRVRYYKTLAALYDPAGAVPVPARTPGQDWAYRARRTCPKCGVVRGYVVHGDACGQCHEDDQKKARRLYARTCRVCRKVGEHPYATDKDYPFWHRCPPCRRVRKAELAEKYAVGLASSQVCPDCGKPVMSRTAALRLYRSRKFWVRKVCDPCEAERARVAEQRRQEAIDAERRQIEARREEVTALELWARDALADPATLILDTETTGLDDGARIVQIAVVTARREVLLDTLVNPGTPIPAAATAIHGITDQMVAGAPSFAEILPRIEAAVRGRRVLIYNREYDVARLEHESRISGPQNPEMRVLDCDFAVSPAYRWMATAQWEDAMVPYSDWYGEEDGWHGGYRWQRLSGGHDARGDCLAVIDRLEAMAKGSSGEDDEESW